MTTEAAGRTPAWAIALCGLLLAWPAAWNGYPLVFADSGTYLGQAIERYLGWDRPASYSLVLHALHWQVTLWTVPLGQGLVAAHLLALLLRVLDRPGAAPLLATTALLAVATGLPWLAAQLMPDVFTGLVILGLWLLGFGRARLSRLEQAWVGLVACGAVVVHFAHVPMALGLALAGGGVAWMQGGRAAAWAAGWRMAAPAVLAAAALVAVNAAGHGRLAFSPFGAVFVAARQIEDGPAVRTLDRHCAATGWRVCALRDRLPMFANDFLWLPEGPLRGELGGGKAWAAEASALVAATLRDEPATVAANGLRNATRQMVMLETGDGLEAWRGAPGPEPLIERYFPAGELAAFRAARQARGLLLADAQRFAPWHALLAWAGLLVLPLAALARRRHRAAVALCVLVLAGAAGNAVLTGALSGPHVRYQARIAWLFVLTPVAVLALARVPRLREVEDAARA